MYEYEELDLNTLLDDPEIDPDSPQALYAIAQCHRLGKGTPVDEALYRQTLQLAAAAGSEPAQQELAAAAQQAAKEADSVPASAPRHSLYEAYRLADQGDPAALLEMAQYSRERGSAKEECDYLQRAARLAGQNLYTLEQEQAIHLRMGELYAAAPLEQPTESFRCYGIAAELGSIAAMQVLADYTARGYGCEASRQQEMAWRMRAAERGSHETRYETALAVAKVDRLRACAMLDEVENNAADETLRTRAAVMRDVLEQDDRLRDEMVETAWTVKEDPEIGRLLCGRYEETIGARDEKLEADENVKGWYWDVDYLYLVPDGYKDGEMIISARGVRPAPAGYRTGTLRITADRADWLSGQPLNYKHRWIWSGCARYLGSHAAAEFLQSCETGKSLYEQAIQALSDKEPGRALALFEQSFATGCPFAANEIGVMYVNGEGVARDLERAVLWYKRGADAGDETALYNYARHLPDTEEGRQERRLLLHRAAEWNQADVLYNLCWSEDAEEAGWALQRLTARAEWGDAYAQYRLGYAYMVKLDTAQGIQWLKKAIDTNHINQKQLREMDGSIYLDALNVLREGYYNEAVAGRIDAAEAFAFAEWSWREYLELCPRLKKPFTYSPSIFMARYYENGVGTPVDAARAVEIYRSADERYEYIAPALCEMGRCYLYGVGVEKDLEQARSFLQQAMDRSNGSESVQNTIRQLQQALEGEEAQAQQVKAAAQQVNERDRLRHNAARAILYILLIGLIVSPFQKYNIVMTVAEIIALVPFFWGVGSYYKAKQMPAPKNADSFGAIFAYEIGALVGRIIAFFQKRFAKPSGGQTAKPGKLSGSPPQNTGSDDPSAK